MDGLLPGTSQARALAADLAPRRRLPVLALACAGLAAGALIAMAEVDRLVAAVVVGDSSATASSLTGPGAALAGTAAAWQRWASAQADLRGDVAGWLGWHLLLDLLLIVGYVGLVRRWLSRRWTAPARVVLLVAAADLLEDLLAWRAVAALAEGRVPAPGLLDALRAVTAAKWLLAALLVAWLVACFVADAGARTATGRSLRALFLQRYSVVVVLVLALLVAVPRGEVFEQLPDVLRGWLDGMAGVAHAAAAMACLLLLVVVLLFVGRMRSRRAWEAYAAGWVPDLPSRAWAWIALPVAVVAAGALLAALGRGRVFTAQATAFVGVPLALAAVSWVIVRVSRSWSWRHLPDLAAATVRGQADLDGVWLPPPRPQRLRLVATTRIAGDTMAVLVLAAAGLGLVRSFTAPALLGEQGWRPGALVLIGLLAASGSWAVGDAVLRRLAGADATDEETRAPATGLALGLARGWPARRIVAGGLATCLAGAALLVLWPRHVSAALGVVATVVLALTVLAAGLGTWVYLSQERLPLSVFRVFRLRATPILTVLLVIAWSGSAPESAGDLHALRPGLAAPDGGLGSATAAGAATVAGAGADATATSPARPTLRGALAAWLAAGRPPGCALTVVVGAPGPRAATVRVAPLLLVAAEGGGIRAATWTVAAMDAVQDPARPGGRCARSAVLAASGVSGGAVGLVLLDRDPDPAGSVARLAGPQSLGATLAGLLAGDLLAGMTGVGVRALDAGSQAGDYADRAALMEASWEDVAPGMGAPLLAAAAPGRVGHLLLNATSVAPACRVLVADVDIGGVVPAAGAVGDGPACTALDSTGPAASYDLITAYGACLAGLRASTAAMLSARFTAVTPTGFIPGCRRRGAVQLVDGGYSEGSGLLTVLDALAAVRPSLQAHNDRVLACATGRWSGAACADLGDDPVVAVPLVLFLENHYRQDLTGTSAQRANEVLAPGRAVSARDVVGGTDALLQRTRDELARTAACGDPGAACARLTAAVQEWAARRVFVASPRTRPQVEAPLGWVLSDASRESLAAAVRDAAEPCPAGGCRPRVGGLGELQAVLGGLSGERQAP